MTDLALQEKLRTLWSNRSNTSGLHSTRTTPQAVNFVPIGADPGLELQARLHAAWPKPRDKADATIVGTTKLASPSTPTMANPAVVDRQPLFIDVETQSLCDIAAVGGRVYAYSPPTKLVSVVAFVNNTVVVWTPNHQLTIDANVLWPAQITPELPLCLYSGPELPEVLNCAIRYGRPVVAHNAIGFDAHVWRALGLPEPTEWIDTLPMARAAGLPGGLDELGLRLFGVGKDEAGKKTLPRIMKPGKDGQLPPIMPDELAQIITYNIVDVALLVGIYAVVRGCGEPEVIWADMAINERGIEFDCDLARKLISVENASVELLVHRLEQATHGAIRRADLARVGFLKEWAESRGVRLADLQRGTLANALASGGLPADVRAVFEARMASTRITGSKLARGIAASHADGRLRDQLVYHGTQTGRWSGKGIQPHNLPRPHHLLEDPSRLLPLVADPIAFVAALPAGVTVADAVYALIRPCFRARDGHVLLIADFAGIEARGTAWCADERKQLQKFAAGEDNYLDLATPIFGRPVTRTDKRERAVGKIAVLGCQYGMGARGFAAYCLSSGVDLAAADTSADAVVEAYRDRYSAIAGIRASSGWREVGLWKNLERAARLTISGQGPVIAGKCTFRRQEGDLVVVLPSGRSMQYRNSRLESNHRGSVERRFGDGDGRSIMYDSPTARNEIAYAAVAKQDPFRAPDCRLAVCNSPRSLAYWAGPPLKVNRLVSQRSEVNSPPVYYLDMADQPKCRFSLRALFALVTICCVWFGCARRACIRWKRVRRQWLAIFRRAGGVAFLSCQVAAQLKRNYERLVLLPRLHHVHSGGRRR